VVTVMAGAVTVDATKANTEKKNVFTVNLAGYWFMCGAFRADADADRAPVNLREPAFAEFENLKVEICAKLYRFVLSSKRIE
jgi:hypothetical protein